MATVGEEIERRREKKEEEERVKEQELAYEARLQQVQALAQQRQEQARQSRLKQLARQVAKKEIKKAVKRRVAAFLARGAAAALAAAAPYILPVLAVIAGIVLVIFIIIATIAVLCNPQGLGQNLLSLTANFSGIVSEETCRAFSGLSGGIASTVQRGGELMCSNPQVLAAQYNTLYPYGDSPNLVQLMSCIERDLTRKGFTNWGSRFTYESPQRNPLCNYTRGNPICGACAHKVNSCHYGGQFGTRGAEAVDYGNEAIANEIIRSAQICGAGFWLNEGNHVHISTQSCGSDGGG